MAGNRILKFDGGLCLLQKYYEDAKYNAAFDRCVDVMTRLIEKYGHQVLEKLDQEASQAMGHSQDDAQAKPLKGEAA